MRADGVSSRRFAAELVRLKVDLIVTIGSPATRAARDATKTIPIVFSVAADPVENSLVGSLAKPGGNLTGITVGLPNRSGCKSSRRLYQAFRASPTLT